MAHSNVIQGCFPNGLPRFEDVRPPAAAQPVRQPASWVQQAIAQPAQRLATQRPSPIVQHKPAVVHRPAIGSAVQVPLQFSGFPRHGGEPLPMDVRQEMERVFGTGFADVRVHVGPHASSMRALAFTNGANIHFAPGQYNPRSPHGRNILAHELAHVVQQRTGRVRNPYGTGLAVVQDRFLEAEADRMSMRANARPVIQRALAYDEDANSSKDDLCGGFQRKITWKLTGSDQGPGMILQHVTKTFSVKVIGSSIDMKISEIKDYVKENDGGNDIADVVDYWEAWEVPKSATAPTSPDDYFMVPCIFKGKRATKNTTTGTIVMKGEAFWYPNEDPSKLGMKKDTNHPSAGLYFSDKKPAVSGNASSTVTRTYTATWDSTKAAAHKGEYGPTKVTLT